MSEKPVIFNAEQVGIGDIILLSWIAEDYKARGHPCLFYVRNGSKHEVLDMLGQQTTDSESGALCCGPNAGFYNYELRIDKGQNRRVEVWASQLPYKPGWKRPNITVSDAETESVNKWYDDACGGKPLVVLFPFTWYQSRRWPLENYVWLSDKLQAAGYYVCAMGTDSRHKIDLARFPYYFYGTSWNHVAAMIRKAAFCVGNDSGPAHLAGTLDAPFVAIMGPTKRVFEHMPSVYEYRVKKEVMGCVGCHFDYDAGYRAGCDTLCKALYRASPEDVFTLVDGSFRSALSLYTQTTNNA